MALYIDFLIKEAVLFAASALFGWLAEKTYQKRNTDYPAHPVGAIFGILAGAFGALYTKWALTPDVRPTCRCKDPRARCKLYDHYVKLGDLEKAAKHYMCRTSSRRTGRAFDRDNWVCELNT